MSVEESARVPPPAVASPGAGPAGGGPPDPTAGRLRGLLAATRPRQWVKNVLVVAAPLAAGSLLRPEVLRPTLVAIAAFVLASAAVYLVNDVRDLAADRAHPVKRHRPMASGAVPVPLALAAAAVLAVGSVAVASATRPALVWVILGYLALQLAYSLGLKHEAVIDLGLVASGFVLRAVAGGAATGLPLSPWFLSVAAGGSLLLVTGKRLGEFTRLGLHEEPDTPVARRSLSAYTASYLRTVAGVCVAITASAYGLWAFALESRPGFDWQVAGAVPFVLALLRYLLLVDQGHGEEPEALVWHDRVLLVLAVAWLALFAVGVLRA